MNAAPPPPQGRRFDHIRALFVQTPASLVGYLIGWSLMVAMYWPLAPRGPMEFFDVEYAIPADLVKDKQRVTVRFEATQGNEVGCVFGLRMIRADAER